MRQRLSKSERKELQEFTDYVAQENSIAEHSFSPLIFAIVRGDIRYVQLLYKAGADLEETDGSLHTPLMWSARHNQTAITTLLLQYGADHSKTDPDGRDAAEFAMEYGEFDHILLLLKQETTIHRTIIIAAVSKGSLRGIELLLQNGVNDLESQDEKGRTVLHHAIAYGRDDITRMLLAHGANIEAQDYNLRTPLIKAVAHKNIVIVNTLCEFHVRLDPRDSDGDNALAWAKDFGYFDISRILLSHAHSVESAKSPQPMLGVMSDLASQPSAVDSPFTSVSSTDDSILRPSPSEYMFINQCNKLWSDRIFE